MSLFAYCKKCKHLFIGAGGHAVVHLCPVQNGERVLLPTKAAAQVSSMHYMDPDAAVKLSCELAKHAVYVAQRSQR